MLVFAAAGLRELSPSWRYELWLVGRRGGRPAGLLPVPRRGMTGPAVATGLEPGDRLGLSVEPADRSVHPTSPSIIEVPRQPPADPAWGPAHGLRGGTGIMGLHGVSGHAVAIWRAAGRNVRTWHVKRAR
jgi:hypothetical protein